VGFKKFGTGEDQRVELDEERAEQIRRQAGTKWNQKDQQELDEENKK